MPISRCLLMLGTTLTFVTAGCSGHSDAGSSQVVAKINGVELTAAQLDAHIHRLPPNVDPRNPNILRSVLQNFIDETLLAQAAEKAKLDKKPDVARDIETARNVVLANAYVSRNVPIQAVSEAQIRQYYNQNNALFADRRIYRLTDLAVFLSAPGAAAVVAEMKRPGASVDSVLAVAHQAGVSVQTNSGEQTADALPDKLAQGLANMEPSDNAVYQVAQTQHFTRIDGVTDSPVDYQTAHNAIQSLLVNKGREAALQARLDQLRTDGKVEYGQIGRDIQAGVAKGAPATQARPRGETTRGSVVARGVTGV